MRKYNDIGKIQSPADFEENAITGIVTGVNPKDYTVSCFVPRKQIIANIPVFGSACDSIGKIWVPTQTVMSDDGNSYLDMIVPDGKQENHIPNMSEALLVRINGACEYACIGFRPLDTEKSELLKAAATLFEKQGSGGEVSRNNDGSYWVTTDDGQTEFVHVTGIRFKFGHKSTGTDPLNVTFTDHPQNKKLKDDKDGLLHIEHPAGHSATIDKEKVEVKTSEGLKALLDNTAKRVSLAAGDALSLVMDQNGKTATLKAGETLSIALDQNSKAITLKADGTTMTINKAGVDIT